jgi:hypothetical protein
VTRSRVAHAITQASAPALLVVVPLLAIGAVSATRPAAALAWAVVITVFVGVIPYTIVEVGVHRRPGHRRRTARRRRRWSRLHRSAVNRCSRDGASHRSIWHDAVRPGHELHAPAGRHLTDQRPINDRSEGDQQPDL